MKGGDLDSVVVFDELKRMVSLGIKWTKIIQAVVFLLAQKGATRTIRAR